MSIDTSKIIHAPVGGGRYTVTSPIVKEDYGLQLQIEGVDLPSSYQVDFSNSEHGGTSTTMISTSNRVRIPTEFIKSGEDIFAFLYIVGSNYGRTVYKFRIPNKLRPDRTNVAPDPEEQSVIDQAIAALNDAVEQTAQDVASADASAQSAQGYAEQAEGYAESASTSATEASASATSAQNSANSASASATASAQSASQSAQIKSDIEGMVEDAQGYADSASQSASASANSTTTAQGYAQSASASAQSASGYASNAQTSANTASAKASEASTSAQTASTKASEAAQSASQASASATASAQSASQSAQIKDDVESMVDDAQASASASAQSATASANSATQAQGYAQSASESAQSASGYASSAQTSANTASAKAQDASGYAQTATQKATESAQSATNASASATQAESAKTASQTAQGLAESARDGAVSAKNDAESARDDAESARDEAVSAVASISGALDDKAPVITDTASGSIASFPDGADNLPLKSLIVDINPIQDLSHGDPSPENLCPISGWTEVGVEQSGVNVFGGTFVNMAIASLTIGSVLREDASYRGLYVRVKGGQTYTVSRTSIETNRFRIAATVDEPAPDVSVNELSNITANDSKYSVTVTIPDGYNYIFVYLSNQSDTCTPNNYQVQIGSTATPYEPYTGRSITIDLGQTVYGGKLDVLSGELVITHKGVDMGSLSWLMQIGSENQLPRFYTTGISSDVSREQTQAEYPVMLDLKAPILGPHSNPVYSRLIDNVMCVLCSNGGFYATCSMYSSAADFKTAVSGMMLVYKLAEPIEIQLDSHTLNSLYGQNNIWADSGDTTAEYRADTKLFIERLTAPDSADMIADANITSGQYFMVGNSLYKATANIANGGQIIVGTNCIRKSLSEALNEINA